MLQNISFFFNFFLFRSSFHFILLLSFRNATGLACATKKGEEEEEKSRGHVCSFERQHEVISFANFFFPLPAACVYTYVRNYELPCLAPRYFLVSVFYSINIYPAPVVLFRELVEFLTRFVSIFFYLICFFQIYFRYIYLFNSYNF